MMIPSRFSTLAAFLVGNLLLMPTAIQMTMVVQADDDNGGRSSSSLTISSSSPSSPPPTPTPTATPTTNVRRHYVEADRAECVLYMAEQDNFGSDRVFWGCEFPLEYYRSKFDGRIAGVVTIEGIANEYLESRGAVSGEHVLKANRGGAMIVEENLDTHEAKLLVEVEEEDPADENGFVIEPISERDPRHERNRRRRLNSSNPGSYTALVVVVRDSRGTTIDKSNAEISSDFFTDSVSLGTQYDKCSAEKFRINPCTSVGGNLGVVNIDIDLNGNDNEANVLGTAAVAEVERRFGGNDGISSKCDFVMFCQPPTNKDWIAYSYIKYWSSFYNDVWCSSVSAQMHEVGHNVGLAHSGVGNDDYADKSGLMGFSYKVDDAPKMCFNAAKMWQLGWYNDQLASYNPINNVGENRFYTLNGVVDYGSNNNAVVVLMLIVDGSSDYYINYNRAIDFNSGTQEGRNQILIVKKDFGGPKGYGLSRRLAELSSNESYKISNWNGNQGVDVTIRVEGTIGGSIRDARISVSTAGPNQPVASPTNPPQQAPQPTRLPTQPPTQPPILQETCTKNRFKLELKLDRYAIPDNNRWTLTENSSGKLIAAGALYENEGYFVEPIGNNNGYCLRAGECYKFTFFDDQGDGICCGQGDGYYTGKLDNIPITDFEGRGAFNFKDEINFCVQGEPTPAPMNPIPVPTKIPTRPPTQSPILQQTCNKNRFQLELTTDKYADDTRWTLVEDASGVVIAAGDLYEARTTYLEPINRDGYCLKSGFCYTFTIYDGYGDGICCEWGEGSYTGFLDGNAIDDFTGGENFNNGKQDVRTFCVDGNPTPLPTRAPTSNPPTLPPVLQQTCTKNRFQVEIFTDKYAKSDDNRWTLKTSSGTLVAEGALYDPSTLYVEPIGKSGYCLQEGVCYQFTMYDDLGDGICCAHGDGFYTGKLDGVNIDNFVGKGAFAKVDTTTFCVEANPTRSPTRKPTRLPTVNPIPNPNKIPTRPPTQSPILQQTCSKNRFQLELTTDRYADDTRWTLVEDASGVVIAAGDLYEARTTYLEPINRDGYCLKSGFCYTFTIYDGYGDGICCNWGEGSYTGFLDGNVIDDFTGGENFNNGKQDVRKFCVEGGSPQPASCEDDDSFKWKGNKKKNCFWVGLKGKSGKRKKKRKRCKKKRKNGLRIYDYCPATCAKVDLGPCKSAGDAATQ